MATDYQVTTDQIVQAAMRQCGALDTAASSIPQPQDYTNVLLALNMIIKKWVTDGIPLWKVAPLTLPLVANQQAYSIGTLGPDLITDRPLRILEAEILTLSNQQSIELWPLAREQWVELSGKYISFGIPTQYYFQTLGSEATQQSALIQFYPIPPVSLTWSVVLQALQPIGERDTDPVQ